MKSTTLAPLLCLFVAGTAAGQIIQSIPADPVTDWHSAAFWHTVDGRPPESSWEFADSEVRLVRPRGAGGSLLSQPLPSNFELSWQWKIEAKTNSGLKYRVRQFGNRWLGVEYQIIDEAGGRSQGKGSTGSIYDLVAPVKEKPLKPVGEWNQSRVVANGNRIEHYLNGEQIAATRTRGPAWDLQFALSKFYGNDGFAKPRDMDRVMLTDHGGKVSYRQFKFVSRPIEEAAGQTGEDGATATTAPQLGNAIRNSWADQDSVVLWTRTTRRAEMVLQGPQFIETSGGKARELAQLQDEKLIHKAQIPEGAKLDQMFGAMPGAEGQVRLSYFPKLQRNQIKTTEWVTTDAGQDFTAQWKLENLKAGTAYAAVVEARPVGGEVTAVVRGGFRTAPKPNQRRDLSFCMTTCHDFIRRDDGNAGHQIYPAMTKMNPQFVVHAGDIEYYDKPDPWALTIPLMRFKWQRLFSLPSNRRFYSQTSSYFLKDDHDTLKNDCWAGQRYGTVTFDEGLKLFNEEQFPSLSPRYTTIRWGRDLQVWFLEGRDYRSPNTMPDGPDKTILGEEQKAWLFRTLDESEAKFKLVFSPTPVVGPDRAGKKDNHANSNFVYEGDQVRREFAKHDHVIVLCGDRHWQYASVDEKTGVWEFGCGPGSAKHQLGWKKGDERPTHRFLRVAGGFLSGQLKYKGESSTLTLRHHKVNGEQTSEFVFPQPE